MSRSLALPALLAACLAAIPPNTSARVTLDLASTAPTLRLEGAAAQTDFGTNLAVGDVNGDGIADLVVSDPPPIGVANSSEAGRTFVFLGGPGFFATPRRAAATADVLLASSRLITPASIAGIPDTGDFDGDGIDDLVIGSPPARLGCPVDCGGTWVVLGRPTWPANVDVETQSHARFRGTGLRFGTAGLVDVDGDDRDDVLILQPDWPAGTASGRVLVYLARNLTAGEFVDAAVLAPDRETHGQAPNARQVGLRPVDLDDDGDDELAVQSGALASARAFPLGADLPAGPVIDLAVTPTLAALSDPITANRTSLLARTDLDGDGSSDELTTSSAVGSLGRTANGVIAARRSSPPLLVGQSRTMGPSVADVHVHGPITDGNVRGQLVADVGGDGRPDIAARVDADTPRATARLAILQVPRPDCAGSPVSIDLASAPDVVAWRPAVDGDFLASSIAVADFDGDGLSDVAIGAPDGDGSVVGGRDGVVVVERGRADWDGDGLAGSADCAPFDAAAGAVATATSLRVTGNVPAQLDWSGTAATWHVLSGLVSELWADRGFGGAQAVATDLASPTWQDARAQPAADAWWYLVVGESACGFSDLGASPAADQLQSGLCALLP